MTGFVDGPTEAHDGFVDGFRRFNRHLNRLQRVDTWEYVIAFDVRRTGSQRSMQRNHFRAHWSKRLEQCHTNKRPFRTVAVASNVKTDSNFILADAWSKWLASGTPRV